jgi:hypothetical protein
MSKILHKIKAFLYPNLLTENPNDFTARVSSERSLGVKDICTQAVTRGGAATTEAAMEHNVNLFLKEMGYQLCDGYSVNTGYFTAAIQIRGVFDSPDENFNPDKHSLLFQFNQGELLRKELPSIEVQIMGVSDTGISIAQVLDVKSGSVNDLLTPDRNLKISGNKLKLAGDHQDVGIYFTNESTRNQTKVDITEIVTNAPSELIIIIPELSPGTYKLSITSQFTGNALLKEPRTTVFDKILTVS